MQDGFATLIHLLYVLVSIIEQLCYVHILEQEPVSEVSQSHSAPGGGCGRCEDEDRSEGQARGSHGTQSLSWYWWTLWSDGGTRVLLKLYTPCDNTLSAVRVFGVRVQV